MRRFKYLIVLPGLFLSFGASAQDHGRIKRGPPTPVETDRMASEMVMNDRLLQKGDIVAADRGFFIYLGIAPDGVRKISVHEKGIGPVRPA